jgi:hypothetical protein
VEAKSKSAVSLYAVLENNNNSDDYNDTIEFENTRLESIPPFAFAANGQGGKTTTDTHSLSMIQPATLLVPCNEITINPFFPLQQT